MNLINDSHESIDHEAEAESLGFNKKWRQLNKQHR